MCNCCCNTESKKCYQFFIIFLSFYILTFQAILFAFAENQVNKDEIEAFILSERPIYDFALKKNELTEEKMIQFFEFKGRKKQEGNRTITYDEKNFTIIYGMHFYYDGKDRNYFDYKNKYSVPSGQSCDNDYQKCGILDSEGRILCLPKDEQCPLNGFGISKIEDDPNFSGYNVKETNYDIFFYYTNKNVEGKIITEFKLSHGQPCAKISENNWITYYSDEVNQDYRCQTSINGNLFNQRYDKVESIGIKMIYLYKDNGLKDAPKYGFDEDEEVQLYVRNFNDMDEACVQGFLDDLSEEDKYYDSVFKTIRSLTGISLACSIAFVIYIITTCQCCCNVTFYSLSMVAPVYGMVVNIVTIGVINKSRVKYKCQLDGFNEAIDEFVDDQYNNYLVNVIMSIFSLVFYSIQFLMTLCLKFMKNRAQPGIATSGVVPITPVGGMMPPVYPVPVTYGRQKMMYQNVMPAPNSYGFA